MEGLPRETINERFPKDKLSFFLGFSNRLLILLSIYGKLRYVRFSELYTDHDLGFLDFVVSKADGNKGDELNLRKRY